MPFHVSAVTICQDRLRESLGFIVAALWLSASNVGSPDVLDAHHHSQMKSINLPVRLEIVFFMYKW